MATYEKNHLYNVPLDELRADPAQPRKYMDPAALEELTASIRQMGIIEPVVCRQDPETGLSYVIAGERRCAAAGKAGLTTVPAVFIDGGNAAEIALVENLLRQDLNPVEEAEALQRLMEEHAYTQEQLATVIGKTQPTISESLSLNRLPETIRNACRQDPSVPKRTLIQIARKKQERGMLTAYEKFREQQARTAAKEGAGTPPEAQPRRTRAEAMANAIGNMVNAIGDMEFPDFPDGDRTILIEALTALKETLDEAIPRAVENRRRLR